MKTFGFIAVAALVSSQAMAAGEVGHWSRAMGMDGQTINYAVTDAKGNSVRIFCGKDPATIAVVLNRHEYGFAAKKDFVMVVDGKRLMPSDAGSNAGGDNFRYVWSAIRAGKKVTVKAGKDSWVVPVADASKALPNDQQSHCESW